MATPSMNGAEEGRSSSETATATALVSMVDHRQMRMVHQTQLRMLDRLRGATSHLNAFHNKLETRIGDVAQKLSHSTHILQDARQDLHSIFRRIRTLHAKLEAEDSTAWRTAVEKIEAQLDAEFEQRQNGSSSATEQETEQKDAATSSIAASDTTTNQVSKESHEPDSEAITSSSAAAAEQHVSDGAEQHVSDGAEPLSSTPAYPVIGEVKHDAIDQASSRARQADGMASTLPLDDTPKQRTEANAAEQHTGNGTQVGGTEGNSPGDKGQSNEDHVGISSPATGQDTTVREPVQNDDEGAHQPAQQQQQQGSELVDTEASGQRMQPSEASDERRDDETDDTRTPGQEASQTSSINVPQMAKVAADDNQPNPASSAPTSEHTDGASSDVAKAPSTVEKAAKADEEQTVAVKAVKKKKKKKKSKQETIVEKKFD